METHEDRTFNFAEAVAYAGVSRHRLHQAIADRDLASLGRGKPGTLLEIRERDLVRWCRQAKVILPPSRKRVRPVRLEDMQRQYEAMLEGFEDILQCMRRLLGDLSQAVITLRVLDAKLGEKLNVISPPLRPPVHNGERPERSIAQK
jgi:hypothetical protein